MNRTTRHPLVAFFAALLLAPLAALHAGDTPGRSKAGAKSRVPAKTAVKRPAQPRPTLANVAYGGHERQVLDFYKAESSRPTPLLFFIHGGGWVAGDKAPVADLDKYLAAGISVVSINYRYTTQAQAAGVKPPVQWPLHDAARALQLVRSKAGEWNIDKARIGASGGSAGACSSLWLAFHDDLADPKSPDPVAGESTRLWCAAVTGAQTTLDPQQMKDWTPNSRYGGHAFGFMPDPKDPKTRDTQFERFLAARDQILPWIKQYSPYEHVSADDPPIYMIYSAPPALGQNQQDPTHTANFGVKLQERLRSAGLECELVYPGAPGVEHPQVHDYLIEKLKALATHAAPGKEFHVFSKGNDGNDGSLSKPYQTISAAAQVAQPGDVITVHEGTYRERVTPPRGGTSDAKRIVYRAAEGEKVVIKGSEVIRDWQPLMPGVWKATLPNSFFGRYNPYKDLIAGDWFTDKGRPHHTGEVYLNGKSLFETHLLQRVQNPQPLPDIRDREGSTFTWFCESDANNTYLYANFHERNPNEELVEINVRDSCFYPDKPGRDYITVRGFRMCHAATQWAAPTAEQIGLIGTHWSKGWIIENNVISDSKCSGITLGKDRKTGHNVWTKDPSKDGAIHYNEVIVRALESGWSREKIGSHIVRNNTIFNCEQTGICGSLGGVCSQITNNHIYNIWTKRQFTGAEMAGIKIHASIDVLIRNNRLHNTGRAIWMDWMAQGTRIAGNLCYDNSTDDLFVEVNHGPFLVDNNLFLSGFSLRDWSQGGAYVHNLMTGRIDSRPELKRSTPYHVAHSTALAGLSNIKGGDNRFHNNVLVGGAEPPADAHKWDGKNPQRVSGFGLWVYDTREFPLQAGGNVYYNGARPSVRETNHVQQAGSDPKIQVVEEGDSVYLHLTLGQALPKAATTLVTTALLGKARIPGVAFENADGSPVIIDTDYFGKKRNAANPSAGPFEGPGTGRLALKVW